MNPLLMAALSTAPAMLNTGVGMFQNRRGANNPFDVAADAQGTAFANTPAQNPMNLMSLEANRIAQLNPNGGYARGFEQAEARRNAQMYNQSSRAADDQLKRNFVVDSYVNAQQLGTGAINSYLADQSAFRKGLLGALSATR